MKKTMKIRMTFLEELLGTASANPALHEEFIASKGPNALTRAEEIEAIGVDGVVEKAMTIFSRNEKGQLTLWDYQFKGFFKETCGGLARAEGTESSKVRAYKKIIDKLIFVYPRQVLLQLPPGQKKKTAHDLHSALAGTPNKVTGECQRSLRIQSPQGERVALANSETVPAGTVVEIEIRYLELRKNKEGVTLATLLEEWLDYGEESGMGCWRNSGKGRFKWEIIE